MTSGMEWVAEERLLRVDAWLPNYSDTYANGVLETYVGYDVHDFQLDALYTWYDGEEYRPPWMEP